MNLQALEDEIEEVISHAEAEEDTVHSKHVRECVLRIDPDAGDALQIAALAHDIERAVPPRVPPDRNDYDGYKEKHAKRSAEITEKLLRKHGADEELIKEVCELIELHEVGGTPKADLLKDADSISYFTTNIKPYLARMGEEQTLTKMKYMYDRMSDRAKQFVQEMDFPLKERLLADS